MRTSLASHLRSIVAFLSINTLKAYLQRALSVLSGDNKLKPIIFKEILSNKALKKEDLKPIYKRLKEIVDSYNSINREPFQKAILGPLRASYDESTHFDPRSMLEVIREQKSILNKSEKELQQARNLEKETLPKGVPPSQISPTTQKVYRASRLLHRHEEVYSE